MIRMLINFYCLVLLFDLLVGYIPAWRDQAWAKQLKAYADWGLKPIRRYLHPVQITETILADLSPLAFFILTRIVFWLW